MTRFDLFAVLCRDPDDGSVQVLGTNATEEGAWHVATEAVDALSLSYSLHPERFKQGLQDMFDSIIVVPAVVMFDLAALND